MKALRYETSAPGVYVLVDEDFVGYAPHWLPRAVPPSNDIRARAVHLMSKHAGGEVRSYTEVEGTPGLYPNDCHPKVWPWADGEVSRLLGVEILGALQGPTQEGSYGPKEPSC